MVTEEKIKQFRNLRGISLETPGQLSGTIKMIDYDQNDYDVVMIN